MNPIDDDQFVVTAAGPEEKIEELLTRLEKIDGLDYYFSRHINGLVVISTPSEDDENSIKVTCDALGLRSSTVAPKE